MAYDVSIDDKELLKLYTGEKSKFRLPEQVVNKFFATVQKIESAVTINDLLADKGLHFEKLKNTPNIYSMRLSGKYRLEMEVDWTDDKKTSGKFSLKTISNHYGD